MGSKKNQSVAFDLTLYRNIGMLYLWLPAIRTSLQVVPKYEGRLKLLKTSVSLPQSIIDDLRRLARIRGMTSYQSLLRELLSEKVYEEKRRLNLFG